VHSELLVFTIHYNRKDINKFVIQLMAGYLTFVCDDNKLFEPNFATTFLNQGSLTKGGRLSTGLLC